MDAGGIVALDVRPILARGADPLADILAALAPLAPGEVLLVTAPFRPAPLLELLRGRGHAAEARACGDGAWSVEVVVGGRPEVEDLTALEPPEPLERVLVAQARLAPGEVYLARLPRYPRLLAERLEERGQRFAAEAEADGATLLRLWRPPA